MKTLVARPVLVLLGALLVVATVPAFGEWSTSRTTDLTQKLPEKYDANRGSCGSVTLTHSSSLAITALNSVSCNSASGHTDNFYYRVFNLASFGQGDFDVCSVEIGVEEATSAGGSQPIEITLYTTPSGSFPGGALTQIGTTATAVADQSLTIVEFPVSGFASAGLDLVVEVFTPNGQASGNFFFIGSNASPETGPSYLMAPDCGVTTPTTTAAIGFPNMHIVMNVNGDPGNPSLAVTDPDIVDQPGFADLCSPDPANENGILEPGDQVSLPIEISAIAGSFTGISATLVSNTAGVDVVSGTSTYPDIASGSSAGPNTPFLLYIQEGVACGTPVDLELTITANEGGPFVGNLGGQVGADPATPSPLPFAIPDNTPAGATSTLSVPNNFVLNDVNVVYQMTHSWVGDVIVTLTPPGGGPITLMDRPGVPAQSTVGCSDNDADVVFDDDGGVDPETHCASTTPWLSGQALAPGLAALAGTNVQGNWVLTVSDNAGLDTGSVTNWNLQTDPPLVGTCNVCVGNAPGGGGGGPTVLEIPALSKVGLALLAVVLAGAAALVLRRRG